jgi:hypothetical protein
VDGSRRGLISDIIPAFYEETERKPPKALVRIADLPAEI